MFILEEGSYMTVCFLYALFWAARCTDVEHCVIIINHSEINIARSILSHHIYAALNNMVELAKKLIINCPSA